MITIMITSSFFLQFSVICTLINRLERLAMERKVVGLYLELVEGCAHGSTGSA